MSVDLKVQKLEEEVGALRKKAADLEDAVKFLLQHIHAPYQYPPNHDQPFSDVAALVYQGDKLGAIKLYREKTGVSMSQAQEFIANL